MGFIKTLTNTPLAEDETSGWQMYDDNKPDMINSFKHIIHAIKSEITIDPAGSIARLGVVLNGILNCPTGQAEAIQSAVNALVHGRNVISSDAKELVGKYIIAAAVEKSFNNAFHQGGGVHGLASARTALAEELGIHHAINGFKERISAVDDNEIPGLYAHFYENFTPAFIVSEARRNIQTPAEYQTILKTVTVQEKEKGRHIKMEKPLSVGNIIEWLSNHGKAEMLHNPFGISEDYSAITDLGLINVFIEMGFLNQESAALKEYMEILEGVD